MRIVTAASTLACLSHKNPNDRHNRHGSAPRMVKEGRAQYAYPCSMIRAAALLVRQFDLALEYYQRAIKAAPSDSDMKRNYSRFVEFYRSFKAAGGDEEEGGADAGGGP